MIISGLLGLLNGLVYVLNYLLRILYPSALVDLIDFPLLHKDVLGLGIPIPNGLLVPILNLPSFQLSYTTVLDLLIDTNLIQKSPVSSGKNVTTVPGNTEDAQQFLYYSAAVYCRVPYGKEGWGCGPFCEGQPNTILHKHMQNNVTNSKGLIAFDPNKQMIIVAFKGSTVLADYMTDIQSRMVQLEEANNSDVLVSIGFYNAAKSLKDEYISALKTFNPDNKYPVLFTGHSLGGAMASIAAVIAMDAIPEMKVQVYTYNSPRSGNVFFANYMNTRNITYGRVFNATDPVSHLPARITGYVHVLSPMKAYTINSTIVWGNCSSKVDEDWKCGMRNYGYNVDGHNEILGLTVSSNCSF